VLVVSAALIGDIDVIKLNLGIFERIQTHELDDTIVSIGLIVLGLIIGYVIARRRVKREAEMQVLRMQVLEATMRTVRDIVNNCLNNLQLFRMDADGVLPQTSLQLFDDVVQDTSARLKALGDLESVPERQMASGIGIDYQRGASPDEHK
jgi:hypothetical protein